MSSELVLCIPGPWSDHLDLVRRVITVDPAGAYMFAGGILAHPTAKDHVPMEVCPRDEGLARAFQIAGQGKLSADTLAAISGHSSVAYLRFPIDIRAQRERLIEFTRILRQLNGFAVKLESCGIAHEWQRWNDLLEGNAFDLYCSAVVLVGGEQHYYSCGMHHFGLAESSAPRSLAAADAAQLINQFNFWRIVEQPHFESGHTFSIDAEAPRFRMLHEPDSRHDEEHLFHNPHGVWRLVEV